MAIDVAGLNKNDYAVGLQQGSNPTANAPSQQMGQAEFLLLLTTQLQNQDPSKPMDPTAFVTDLTQMSQLESTNAMNASITAMTKGFQAMQTMQASSLIGKNVQVVGSEMSHTSGTDTDIRLSLSQPLTDVKIVISDSDGIVKELDAGDLPSGNKTISWDGLDDVGAIRDSGQFELTVYGTDEAGDLQAINTIVPSQVNSISVNPDGTMTLTLATGERVAMDAVREISA